MIRALLSYRGWAQSLWLAIKLVVPAGVLVSIGLSLFSCEGPSTQRGGAGEDEPARGASAVDRGPRVDTLQGHPDVRVRVRRHPVTLTIRAGQRGEGEIRIGRANTARKRSAESFSHAAIQTRAPVTIERKNGAFFIRSRVGDAWRWPTTRLRLQGTGQAPVLIGGNRYPGYLTLVAAPQQRGPSATAFDVVNHLPLETYVAGVLAKELYPSWAPATFRAQAIAARSYALFEAHEYRHRHFDLSATTASQVYKGLSDNPRATAAARATRGQVLVYRDRVLPAYYASACGGTGQSAHQAFEEGWQVKPLMGRAAQGYCRASDKYRWGPIDRRARDLAWRIKKWGAARGHPVKALAGLRAIRVSARNHAGRPAAFTLTDARGRSFTLRCEAFRMACNYDAGRLSDIPKAKRLYSSHVTPRVHGSTVRFVDGRGFGHGVGMCQWGAQGMARRGYDHRRIVQQYYPGAQLNRLY